MAYRDKKMKKKTQNVPLYDVIFDLCKKKGISVSKMAADLGLGNSTASHLKNGRIPKNKTISLMAKYLGVVDDTLFRATMEQYRCSLPDADIWPDEQPQTEEAKFYELLMGACAMNHVAVEDIIREFGLSDDIASGRAMPDLDTIIKISERLRVRTNWFTGEPLGNGEGYMLPDPDDEEPGLGHTTTLSPSTAELDGLRRNGEAVGWVLEVENYFESFVSHIIREGYVHTDNERRVSELAEDCGREISGFLDAMFLYLKNVIKRRDEQIDGLENELEAKITRNIALKNELKEKDRRIATTENEIGWAYNEIETKDQRIATLESELAEKAGRIAELSKDDR